MFDEASRIALLLACIAGFSTMIGAAAVTITKKKSERLLSIALGFAAGVMISVAFTDMMPEAMEYFGVDNGVKVSTVWTVAFIAVGLLIATLADKLIPHKCVCGCGCEGEMSPEDDVERVGIVTVISTALHNLPEGVALFIAGSENITLGITLTIAIVLHNIPGGIAVASPIYFATGKRGKTLLYALIPSVVQPLGALLACVLLRNVMTPFVMGALFAVVAGFLLFVALVELYPSSQQYGYWQAGIFSMFTGIVLMPLLEIIA